MIHQPTEPRPPDMWFAATKYQDKDYYTVIDSFGSPDDPELIKQIKNKKNKTNNDNDFFILKDDSSIPVWLGYYKVNKPEDLSARDTWFLRYASILDHYLKNPIRCHVYTYSWGELADPLSSYKGAKSGPFPWPKGKSLPKCLGCGSSLVFLGVLDYRKAINTDAPKGSLVIHGCEKCGFNEDSHLLQWITNENEFDMQGAEATKEILVGKKWEITDYTPITVMPGNTYAFNPKVITDNGPFLIEADFFHIVTCHANKVGGHIWWIHNYDDPTPEDSQGQKMKFIGQLLSGPEYEIGDEGTIYLFYSDKTKETKLCCQCF